MKCLFVTLKDSKDQENLYEMSLFLDNHMAIVSSSEEGIKETYSYDKTKWSYKQKDGTYCCYSNSLKKLKDNEWLGICIKAMNTTSDKLKKVVKNILYVVTLYGETIIDLLENIKDYDTNININIGELEITDNEAINAINRYFRKWYLDNNSYYTQTEKNQCLDSAAPENSFYSTLLTKWYYKAYELPSILNVTPSIVRYYYTYLEYNRLFVITIQDYKNILDEDFMDNILMDTLLEMYRYKEEN